MKAPAVAEEAKPFVASVVAVHFLVPLAESKLFTLNSIVILTGETFVKFKYLITFNETRE